MCDGWSADEVNALHHEHICSTGWTTTGVYEGPYRPTWVYTVGLALVDHPESLVAGVAPERATEVLDDLARRVVAGERYDDTGEATCSDGVTVALRDVHPVHIERGLVGAAQRYYDWAGGLASALRVRQVVLPASAFCRCHVAAQPRLHLAHVLFGAAGPQRAERRRTARRRRSAP
jgi:hypothetical protein